MTHRGRTKKGKKAIQIRLSDEEYAQLCESAERECRSATMQATFAVLKYIRQEADSYSSETGTPD